MAIGGERTKAFKVDPPESVHADFKKLVLEYNTNMRARALDLLKLDIQNWQHGTDTLEESIDNQQAKQDCAIALGCWKMLLEGRVPPEPELIKLCAIFDADAAELRGMLRKAIGGKRTNGV